MGMKTLKEYIEVNETKAKELVDDVVSALGDINVSNKVYDDGNNFNIGFKGSDGVEYYIRPNDKGNEEYYIDADKDDFDSFKVSDTEALKKKVKELTKKKDD